jgi:hypothetical protein
MFESFIGFYPIWLALICFSVALMLPLNQSCRQSALQQAGQAPPLNGGDMEQR